LTALPHFATNLSMMFNEWDFLDRFAAAADTGFEAVEFLVPYDHRPEDIAARLQRHNLTQALFNLPPGDWAAGERGLAALPERAAEFRASVETALRYALATRVKRLHVMSGTADRHDHAAMTAYRAALAFACEAAAVHQIDVVIELINAWTCRVIFSIISISRRNRSRRLLFQT
jgi:hydroxypyruvate isomerase